MTTALTTRITAGTGATVKGTPLSSTEIDNNFLSLNDNKIETSEAVTTNTANKVVKRDSSGGFSAGAISVGAITATGITISGGAIPTSSGGTGATTYTSGQLLIGNSSGSLTKATLTGTANQITVTNGSGSITLSTPQDLASSSNVQHGSLGIGTAATSTPGEIVATNQITSYYSDERLKTKLGDIEDALNKVMALSGFYYEANETAQALGYTVKREVGVSAQQVQAVQPEAVAPAPVDSQYLTVHYERLVPLLIQAIKELNNQVQELKNSKV